VELVIVAAGAVTGLFVFAVGTGWMLHKRFARRSIKNEEQPLVVGIIGGLGPKASALFYDENITLRRVGLFKAMHASRSSPEDMLEAVKHASTANWTAKELAKVWATRVGQDKLRDQDHVSVLMYSNPTIPGRPEFMSGQSDEDPTDALRRTALALEEGGAGALCMVCSTAHHFKNGMLRGVQVPFLDMLDLTFDFIARNVETSDKLRIGLLGTEPLLRFEIYETAFSERADEMGYKNVEIFTPLSIAAGNQDNFTEAIFSQRGIKAGYDSDLNEKFTFRNFELLLGEVLKLQALGVDAIVLGCTEIPLLLTEENLRTRGRDIAESHAYNKDDVDKLFLVNPSEILGDEVIRLSLLSRIA